MAAFKNGHDINLSNKRKRIQPKGFISKQEKNLCEDKFVLSNP